MKTENKIQKKKKQLTKKPWHDKPPLPISCSVLADCCPSNNKSHAGYKRGFLCPWGPVVGLLSDASTTLQFPR